MQMSVARHVICSNAAGWTLVSPRLSTSHACPCRLGPPKERHLFCLLLQYCIATTTWCTCTCTYTCVRVWLIYNF